MGAAKSATSAAPAPAKRVAKTSPGLAQADRVRREDPALLRELLGKMLLIRRFEEKAAELYTHGKIGGFCHLYIGQEAVGVGAVSTLKPDDYILASYREHGHALTRGLDPGEIMAELCGKQSGVSRGKGGSMHLFDKRHGFLGGHAIVGGQIPLAAGVAFASKYLGQSRVTLCFFGEAAVNIGSFHETLNLAALWKLPVVFICENNRFGMGTPVERASSLYNLSGKACAYDMARAHVDGMDVLAIRDVVGEAVERARQHREPTLIEARTYRFMGHSMSDPVHGHYRTKAEVEEHRKQDPIKRLVEAMEANELLSPEQFADLDNKVREIIEDAVAFAERSAAPDASEIYNDVYAG
jgi:pyruvate dehydrogenase E1 component alpha subunit